MDTPEKKAARVVWSSSSPESMSITAVSEHQRKSDHWLIEHLRERFNIPDEYMYLAMEIWWDGKED